ncbi:MAG: ATP-dependent DNA helicase RecG [Chloroflexi bacterium]|nr:ATP-dependent DNA helicase RecG [Chloroflexota bacterium]
MPFDVDALRKVIELEKKKGCADTAVIGGLNRFLGNWALKNEASATNRRDTLFFKKLAATSYAALTPEERRVWLDELLEALSGLGGGNPPAKESPGAVLPRPVRKKPPAPGILKEPDLDAPVTRLRGVSGSLAGKLNQLGVRTVRDLLYFFPRRHIDYSQTRPVAGLAEGEQTVVANVWSADVVMLGGKRGTEAILGDETGNIRAVWFNQPYLAKTLRTNSRVALSGRVSLFRGRYVFESPEWESVGNGDLIHTARLVPVYPLTGGLYPRQLRKLMKEVAEEWSGALADFLPADLKQRCRLLDLSQAVAQAHYPDDQSGKDKARLRLAFDELFLLQIGVMGRKRDWRQGRPGQALDADAPLVRSFLSSLPFELTGAQKRVLGEIMTDLRKTEPMSRLLQGDVGSGKTVLATAALLTAAAAGYQSALMAPTEILAGQHFATIGGLLSNLASPADSGSVLTFSGLLPRPLRVALLTGDISQSRKHELQQLVSDREIDIAIGTHALTQKGVEFSRLGLVVIDEQHRFGVAQRSALRQKGLNAHMLVMTATPIPRTLALTMFGDLDISVLDELPPGRQSIKTRWLKPAQRSAAYAFIRQQAVAGRQAFIICPLIEESDAVQAQAAVSEYQTLSEKVFPDLRLGLLHGRMTPAEKDAVMGNFRAGEIDILVSTPVIEVGIDVPNATVMLVESADRFGLSQLHQFRGRVGRGAEQSYCMLLADNPSEVGRQRLDIIERVRDGFVLAEEDLKMRGPGEFFGTRQSGLPDLRMARLSDLPLLQQARSEATALFEKDPYLKEHPLLAKEVARVWSSPVGERS